MTTPEGCSLMNEERRAADQARAALEEGSYTRLHA